MKKLLYIGAIIVAIISFSGCYSDRPVVYERPGRRVMVAPPPYYYRPAPVIIEPYRSHGYYGARSRRRGMSHGYGRY